MLGVIKILRRLPHSWAFDQHLTDCAAYEVVCRVFDATLPEMPIAHIFRPTRARSFLAEYGM